MPSCPSASCVREAEIERFSSRNTVRPYMMIVNGSNIELLRARVAELSLKHRGIVEVLVSETIVPFSHSEFLLDCLILNRQDRKYIHLCIIFKLSFRSSRCKLNIFTILKLEQEEVISERFKGKHTVKVFRNKK